MQARSRSAAFLLAAMCLIASVGPGAARASESVRLPEIRSVETRDCIAEGAELVISGTHLGTSANGWTIELAGVTLEIVDWSAERILAKVPAAVPVPPATQVPLVLRLRSLSGGVLARAEPRLRFCDSAPVPAPDLEPPNRGVSPRQAGTPEPATRAAEAELALEGEILIAAPDAGTASSFERSALALGPEEPVRRTELEGLGLILLRVRYSDRAVAEAAVAALRRLHPDIQIEPNRVYRREDGLRASEDQSSPFAASDRPDEHAGWRGAAGCGRGHRIGIVDTALDFAHPDLSGANVVVRSLVPERSEEATSKRHGTAVASLLVGRSLGMVPAAELYDASVFWKEHDEIVSSAEAILRGLSWLVSARVEVINLSLTGPESTLVSEALRRARRGGIELVAAAGNGGPRSPVAFPASHPDVLAVTAVDARRRIYPRAPHGDIDLAAPGVDVRVANAEDSREAFTLVSGTSYAAPFVAAALVLNPSGFKGVSRSALDLGLPGKDFTFGWGLLRSDGLCDAVDD